MRCSERVKSSHDDFTTNLRNLKHKNECLSVVAWYNCDDTMSMEFYIFFTQCRKTELDSMTNFFTDT